MFARSPEYSVADCAFRAQNEKTTNLPESTKVAGTARFASVTPPEAKPAVPVFFAVLLALMLPGALVFGALYLTFQSLAEPIWLVRWLIAAFVVIATVLASAILGRLAWRQLRLPGKGPQEFLPVRWLIHRRATARVKRLVAELAAGEATDPVSAIKQLAIALEKRDIYTRIHSGRVSRLACQIAEHLGRPAWEAEQARMAGLLHDLGKLEIPDSILFKPQALDHREERIMRTHPILSAELVAPFIDAEVVDAVLHHHERVDGGGYPTGVLLCDRDLLCRVVPVCDTYDTLISDRPYRAGRSKKEAWEELRAVAGTQLDADLVEALIEVEREKSRVPAAAALIPIGPVGGLFRKMTHLIHTSTAPAAAAVASVMAAAAIAVGPAPAPASIQQTLPVADQPGANAARVLDDVPPQEVQEVVEQPEQPLREPAPIEREAPAPSPVAPAAPASSNDAPTSPSPVQPQECKMPVTGTDFPTIPPIGCPFSLTPPR